MMARTTQASLRARIAELEDLVNTLNGKIADQRADDIAKQLRSGSEDYAEKLALAEARATVAEHSAKVLRDDLKQIHDAVLRARGLVDDRCPECGSYGCC